MLLTSDQLRRRRNAKWSRYPADVTPAWIAEMDFATDPQIRAAVEDAVDREMFGYPSGDGGLQQATADFLASRYAWRVPPSRVHVLPDVIKGVELAVRHYTPAGSGIVLPTPAYMPFFQLPLATDRPCFEVPTLGLEAIDRAFAAGARSIILCHPSNPLGHSYTVEEMAALSEVVDRHGAVVIADEIHAPLTYAGRRHVPYASVSEAADGHTLTLVSATKAWNLPGLKCAQVVVPDDRRWREVPPIESEGASTLGIVASEAAYVHGGPWLEEVLAYLDVNRRDLVDLLAKHLPGAIYKLPDATYLAWIDCRPLGLAGDPSQFFLDEARVATSPGPAFGPGGSGHIRFNFATSTGRMRSMLQAMGVAAARFGSQGG